MMQKYFNAKYAIKFLIAAAGSFVVGILAIIISLSNVYGLVGKCSNAAVTCSVNWQNVVLQIGAWLVGLSLLLVLFGAGLLIAIGLYNINRRV